MEQGVIQVLGQCRDRLCLSQTTRSARSGRPLAECNTIKCCAMQSTGRTLWSSTNVSNCLRYLGPMPTSYVWKRSPKRNSRSPSAMNVATEFSNNDVRSTPRPSRELCVSSVTRTSENASTRPQLAHRSTSDFLQLNRISGKSFLLPGAQVSSVPVRCMHDNRQNILPRPTITSTWSTYAVSPVRGRPAR